MIKKHLDLGCGLKPRNPYMADSTFGCDIRDINFDVEKVDFYYKQVNLVIDPIPYPDNYFDSVSAYDFFEHVPRQLILPSGEAINPFINLMSEIHRVLRPNGKLLALTPSFPHPAAFTDPTHVNFITEKTHEYFTGNFPTAAMYGFKGAYKVVKVIWETSPNAYNLNQPDWRKIIRRLHRRLTTGRLSHLMWELAAIK